MTKMLFATLFISSVLMGCGPIPSPNPVHSCTPGTTTYCSCPGLLSGAQRCNSDGSGYGECVCPSSPDASVSFPDASFPQPDGASSPRLVSISILDTTFAPFKAGGRAWDGNGMADQDAIDGLARVVAGLGPYGVAAAAVGSIVSRLALPTLALPDPFGTGEIYAGGRWQAQLVLATEDENAEDRYFTTWPRRAARDGTLVPPGWIHVPLTPELQVRLSLFDCDSPLSNDAMGNPVVNYDQIVHALETRQTVQVNVSEQTQNQVLTVGISVTGE